MKSLNAPTTAQSVQRLGEANTARGLPPYAPITSPGPWDAVHSIYNWKGSNTRRLAHGIGQCMVPVEATGTGGGIATHVVFGDSASAGAASYVGPILFNRERAWPIAMRDQLANMGVAGNGTGMRRHVDGASVSVDPFWSSYVGTWGNFSWGCQVTTLNASVTGISPKSGRAFSYRYYDSTGATWTIAVDGVVVRTITMSGTAGWKTAHVTGLNIVANVTKIVLTQTVVGTGGIVAGGYVWAPNGGLVVHNVSQSGSTAAGTGNDSWNTGGGISAYDDLERRRQVTTAASTLGSPTLTVTGGGLTADDIGKPWDQVTAGSGLMFPDGTYVGAVPSSTTATMWSGFGDKAGPVNAVTTQSAMTGYIGRDPSCIHIALGGNDLMQGKTAGTAAATTIAAIKAAVTARRNLFPNSDCILHLGYEVATTLVPAADEALFQAGMYDLADTLDVPLYDWRDQVGTFAQALTTGEYGDFQAHIITALQMSLGAGLAAAIGPGGGRSQTLGDPVADLDVVPKQYIDNKKTKTILGTATTATETVVLRLPVPAGVFKVGDAIRYVLAMKPAVASATTVRVRIGSTGTISDAAVVAMSATTAATSAAIRYAEGQTGIQAIGATATHLGVGTETVGAVTASGTATATSGSFNSTAINYVTVTVQNGTSTTTTVYSGVLELV